MSKSNDGDETFEERKERYEQYLRTLKSNTGGPDQPNDQPAAAKISAIGGAMANAGHHPDDVRRTKQAAINNGDVIEFMDSDDNQRVCLRTTDALKSLLAELNDDPDAYRLSRDAVYQLIQEAKK